MDLEEFKISFGWESQLISPIGFYFSVFREDKEQQIYNPYKLKNPNSKKEKFVDGRFRKADFVVDFPGNYIISLRSDDHQSRLKESKKKVKKKSSFFLLLTSTFIVNDFDRTDIELRINKKGKKPLNDKLRENRLHAFLSGNSEPH